MSGNGRVNRRDRNARFIWPLSASMEIRFACLLLALYARHLRKSSSRVAGRSIHDSNFSDEVLRDERTSCARVFASSQDPALLGTRNGQIWAASVSQSERLTDFGIKHDVHKNHPPLPIKLSAMPLNFYGFSRNMKCEPPSIQVFLIHGVDRVGVG